MKSPRITCKNLGLLKLENFCERCFWLQMRLWHNAAPFRFFPPGLIMKLDGLQKRMIIEYWQHYDVFPEWLGEFTKAVDCEEGSKLIYECPDTGLTLSGVPDLIFIFGDDSIGILDDKTAYMKEGKDRLLPLYAVQANAYAFVTESEGHTVSRVALAYFEGDCGQIAEIPAHELVTYWGHHFEFFVRLKELELAPDDMIPPLLEQVAEIYSLEEPPDPSDDCPDCAMMADFLRLVRPDAEGLDQRVLRDALNRQPLNCGRLGVMALWDYSGE